MEQICTYPVLIGDCMVTNLTRATRRVTFFEEGQARNAFGSSEDAHEVPPYEPEKRKRYILPFNLWRRCPEARDDLAHPDSVRDDFRIDDPLMPAWLLDKRLLVTNYLNYTFEIEWREPNGQIHRGTLFPAVRPFSRLLTYQGHPDRRELFVVSQAQWQEYGKTHPHFTFPSRFEYKGGWITIRRAENLKPATL